MSRLDSIASQQHLSQPKRPASAELPSLPKSTAAVPPKKRARNQLDGGGESAAADANEAVTAAAPLDLSAAGREKIRRREDVNAESEQTELPPLADSAAAAGAPSSAAAAAAAAAYMARCTESLRAMGLAPPSEDPTDSWLAMSHWQASLHAQYLYYSSLALSGFLPPPPPPPPHHMVSSGSKPPPLQPPSSLLSPDFSSLFAPPQAPPPPVSAPQPQIPPPLPPQAASSQSQRSVPERTPSPARQHSTPQQQHQHHQQQRRIKACRAMLGTPATSPTLGTSALGATKASPSASASTTHLSSTTERQTSGETDFQCSCGKTFASLIGLTLHLKETGHGPGSAYSRDRDIPKLVRGQDMWINSETEQTREILRCIRCKQSFRTLPELTMHMMKTRHYTEIIYTDAAPPPQQPMAPSMALRLPAGLVSGSQTVKEERPAASVAAAASREQRPSAGHHRSGRTEVKEADSATDPQPGRHQPAEESGRATSTLQKMQHFVEVSLPRPGLRRPGMFQEVLQNSLFDGADRGGESDVDDEQPREGGGSSGDGSSLKGATGDPVSYLSPDRLPDPKENPLSSLQKLVDTAEKTSTTAAACLSMTASAAATAASVQASGAPTSATTVAAAKSPGRAGSPTADGAGSGRHTVIMLSPTYIYQGGLYPPFPVCHPSALLGGGGGSGSGPMDLSKLPAAKQQQQQRPEGAPTPTKKLSSAASTSAASGGASGVAAETGDKAGGGSWPESLMQKKAKCHYCSKPFANKGQVRLHISKGKCPSLLARLPTAALPPFPFFPAIDYIKAANGGRFHAPAAAPASGKELQA